MKREIPDEQGWYWTVDRRGNWAMAFVDTANEMVYFWDGDGPDHAPARFDMDSTNVSGISQWYGPFSCPGGDFGQETVVVAEEDHQRAKRNKEAIVIVHVDFRHCFGKRSGGSITSVATMPREQANEYVKRETEAFSADSK